MDAAEANDIAAALQQSKLSHTLSPDLDDSSDDDEADAKTPKLADAPAQTVGFSKSWGLMRTRPQLRLLFIGAFFSVIGDFFSVLACVARIRQLTVGEGVADLAMATDAPETLAATQTLGRYISLYYAVINIPRGFMLPVAGPIADTFNPLKTMVITDLIRMMLALTLIFATQLWYLYTCVFILFCLEAVFEPARFAIIPLVIEPDEVIGAQSVMGSAWSVSCFMGSALGGVVVASMGIEANYGIDAGTFLISALASATLLWQSRNGTFELRKRKKEASSEQEASLLSNTEDGVVTENEVVDEGELSLMQEVRRMPRLFVEGVKYLWARPFVFGITGLIGAAAFVWEATDIFSLVMIASQWPIGEHGGLSLSLLYAVEAIGVLLGPLVLNFFVNDSVKSLNVALMVAFCLTMVANVALTFSFHIAWLLVFTAIRCAGSGSLWTYSMAAMQKLLPESQMGRASAIQGALFTVGSTASSGLAALLQSQKPRVGLAVMAGLSLVLGLTWITVLVKKNRTL